MKVLRNIIRIDEELCDGCGQCVPGCAEGALTIIDGKARLIAEKYCDGLGACLGECPTGALQVIEREADDFDEAAVEALLAAQKAEATGAKADQAATMPCGCASSHIQSFAPTITPCQVANQPRSMGVAATGFPEPAKNKPTPFLPSSLTHWPVQIRLVPPEAPFLRGADLLIAADCVPVAHPSFNRELLPGKVVLLGCPKLDDTQAYVAKFSEIFRVAGIKSITIAIMEVPCCGSMRGIIQTACQQSGVIIPVEEVVVGVRGNLL